LPGLYTREPRGRETVAPQVAALNVPDAVVSTTFCTHVVRASFGGGLGIGSGGPKKQFASGRQEVAPPPQSASEAQVIGDVWVPAAQFPGGAPRAHEPAVPLHWASLLHQPLTQCLPGPEPLVQSFGPV